MNWNCLPLIRSKYKYQMRAKKEKRKKKLVLMRTLKHLFFSVAEQRRSSPIFIVSSFLLQC